MINLTTYKSNLLHGKEIFHVISKTFSNVHSYTTYNWSLCLSLSDDRAVYTLRFLLLKVKTLSKLHIPLTSLKTLKWPYERSHWIICIIILNIWEGNYQRLQTKMNLQFTRVSYNLRIFKSTTIAEVNVSLIWLSGSV